MVAKTSTTSRSKTKRATRLGANAKARTQARKSAKSNKSTNSSSSSFISDNFQKKWIRQWLGYFVLTICVVSILSFFASIVIPEGRNPFGPYIGDYWAKVVSVFLGRLPLLPELMGMGLICWAVSSEVIQGLRLRYGAVALAFGLQLAILLSLRLDTGILLYNHLYQTNGGMLGVFLVKSLVEPVFGVQRIVPAVLFSLTTLATIIFGIPGLAGYLFRVFHRWFLVLKNLPAAIQEHWNVPSYTAAMPGQPSAPVTPFKMKRNGPEPIDFDRLHKNRTSKKVLESIDTTGVYPQSATSAVTQILNPVEANVSPEFGAYTTKTMHANTGSLESLDATAVSQTQIAEMDTRELRKYRDEMADKQRIRELNQWEDKKGKIAIGGLLAKKEIAKESAKELQAGSPQSVRNTAQNPAQHTASNTALQNRQQELAPGATPIDDLSNMQHTLDVDTFTHKPIDQEAITTQDSPNLASESFDSSATESFTTASANTIGNPSVAQPIARPVKKPLPVIEYDEYVVPDYKDVFTQPPEQIIDFSEDELQLLSERLESQLLNFRVKGKVVGICTGPVITRFEVELAPGVKVSRISGLADDLALALKAKSMRILAPIPGKAAVGIEIPNEKPHIVYCREILESPLFSPDAEKIKIILGKDIAGDAYSMDLAKAPHLLIAGQTGSGKSVCINTLMASILCSKTPDEVRMILVDPKVVELKMYENIPHLMHPVVTQPEVAVQALQWACFEMDRRYEVLAAARVRNIAGFNKKFLDGELSDEVPEDEHKRMPFLVIIIDELADLMMVAGKEVEVSIARIAQKARAVGIHLVLATQRPSTNVITGVIKANLPTRIAFKVASHIDARTILDHMGAEKLLGRGDMLFRAIENPDPVRVHGAFLSDDEAEALAEACSNQNVDYPQLQDFQFGGSDGEDYGDDMDDVGNRDPLFADAAELVVQSGNGSVSMLQRRLSVGHSRAGRIMDQLEAAGIVGRSKGSKSRDILMNDEELRSFLSGDIAAVR
jgi:DNA segregation ATPase FtsK/SpoIIIE, S-DNA-T family